jgi:hypothetical protein
MLFRITRKPTLALIDVFAIAGQTIFAKLELILAGVTFVFIGVVLSIVAGGPIYSDEIWYMQVGLNNIKDPLIPNRYFHVFLQKLFMEVAPTPLIGVKIFWAFLVSLTGFLIYLNARFLSAGNNWLHGVLAVTIFYSTDLLREYSGVTIIDITAMTMVMVVVTIYVFSLRINHSSPWLLFCLGCAFFLAFKTKETTLLTGILLIGLGYQLQDGFKIERFKINLLRFGAGSLAGLILMVVLNAFILRDPLFGLRPDTFMVVANYYSGIIQYLPEPENWFTSYLISAMFFPFLLYLLSGMRAQQASPVAQRLLWVVPLALVVLLTLSMIRSTWGINPRYIFPVLGIMCVLAPQHLPLMWPESWRKRLILVAGWACGLISLFILRLVVMRFTTSVGLDYASFYNTIFVPIILAGFLAILFLVKEKNLYVSIVTTLCLLVLFFYPTVASYKSIVLVRPVEKRFSELYYPFSAFQESIHFTPQMKFYVSAAIPGEMSMLDDNRDTLLSMFNVYFHANSIRSNFVVGEDIGSLPSEVEAGLYDYILLSERDWEIVGGLVSSRQAIEENYSIRRSPTERLLLLEKRK